MPPSPRPFVRTAVLLGLATLAGVAAAAPAPLASSGLRPLGNGDPGATRLYIVQVAGDPAVAVPGLQPAGARFDSRAAGVRGYARTLVAAHDDILGSVGAADAKVYSYRYALNGFAARLTEAQARKLATRADVRRVWPDRLKQVSTNASATALGLDDRNGGLAAARGLTGEGVVIGVIDSGIVPEHPSFSDRREANQPRLCRSAWAETNLLGRWLCKRFRKRPSTLVFARPADWTGACEAGPGFATTSCNNKLIGARFYVDGFRDEYDLDPNEFLSPRDADGHGSHIASTAAGNSVKADIGGTRVAGIRGMAPRAWLAVYKACWLEPGSLRGACSTADLARAIEDAVVDGVDIINYSVGSDDGITDPDDLALLAATGAGVLAVAAAGNDGPTPETVLSPAAAPWTLAVGAATRSGDVFQTALAVNSPDDLAGRVTVVEAGFTPSLGDSGPVTAALVRADDGVAASFDDGTTGSADDACEALANSSAVAGKVVLVARGGCNFTDKIANAEDAGADAVVIYNSSGAPLIMVGTRGAVAIPAVMVSRADGDRLATALDAGDAVEVTLERGLVRTVRDTGNRLEQLSARGPNFWVPDVLKPDVVAPGVNILGAHTPDSANNQRGERFQYLSGTSMAVPHVAGVAALLKQAHPDWSPAALHSALVTTARADVVRTDGNLANPFDVGGGYIRPNLAVQPGLVYDRTVDEYDAFLCGAGEPRAGIDCAALAAAGLPLEAADLNLPSIALADLVAERTVTRRVTNVGAAASFSASVEAPPGVTVTVEPPLLSLGPGETASFDVRITATDAPLDAWQFGTLTWTGGEASVRSPLAVQARPFAAEPEVAGAGADGSGTVAARAGYTGPYQVAVSGFEASGQGQAPAVQAQLRGAFVRDDGDPDTGYAFATPGSSVPADVRRFAITVPAGTRLLRVALFDADTDGDHDLDLYLYSCPAFVTCVEEAEPSVGPDSDEAITLVDPPAGEYFVDVHGFATAGSGATFDLSAWTLGTDRGNATVAAPANVLAGDTLALPVTWTGLPAGRSLALLTHRDASRDLAYTVIGIEVAAGP
jgi:subtilisin family serine protease